MKNEQFKTARDAFFNALESFSKTNEASDSLNEILVYLNVIKNGKKTSYTCRVGKQDAKNENFGTRYCTVLTFLKADCEIGYWDDEWTTKKNSGSTFKSKKQE